MTPGDHPQAAWFGPEHRPALEDFWDSYQRHSPEIQAQTLAMVEKHPAFAPLLGRSTPEARAEQDRASRQRLRAAIDGDWASYEAGVRAQGAGYAVSGLSLQAWFNLTGMLQERLVPVLLSDYPREPARAAAALQVSYRLLHRVMAILGEEYLATKERLIDQHRTVAQQQASELASSERRYRALFDSSPLPMWVYETRGMGFLAVNEAAVRRYGFSREQFARMTLKDIRPAEDGSALAEDVARARGHSDPKVWRHRTQAGELI